MKSSLSLKAAATAATAIFILTMSGARADATTMPVIEQAPSTVEYASNRVIIKFKSDVVHAMAASEEGLKYQGTAGATGTQVYTITKPNTTVDDMIKQLQDHPAVEAVEPDYKVHVFKVPSDPFLSKEWHLNKVQAMDSWNYSTGNVIKVCHVDSGVRMDHPDLVANVVKGWNFVPAGQVDGTSPPATTDPEYLNYNDTYGHGTHTAGIIGAVGNNNRGISGMNWQVKLYVCRFIWNDGSGYISDAMKCISLCSAEGAMITSNSWGGIGYSDFLKQEIQNAQKRGQLFVVASGNSGQDLDAAPLYPASYDLGNMISVASTGTTDALSSFSNTGANTVDIAAPGEAIYSTTYNGDYGLMWGTSMATPIVSGVAALLQAQAQAAGVTLTYSQLKDFILQNGDIVAGLQGKIKTGMRLNAYKAAKAVSVYIKSLVASSSPSPQPSPSPASPPASSPTALTQFSIGSPSPSPVPRPPSPAPAPNITTASLASLAGKLVCGTSVLRGKRATQSSMAKGVAGGSCGLSAVGGTPYAAARAVDGRCQGIYTQPAKGTCSMTAKQDNPWWQADLGSTTTIMGVAITTRSDCNWAQLGGAQIWLGPRAFKGKADAVTGGAFTRCATVPAAGIARGQRKVFACANSSGISARYIGIYLPKTAARLTLCEVDVFTQDWLAAAASSR